MVLGGGMDLSSSISPTPTNKNTPPHLNPTKPLSNGSSSLHKHPPPPPHAAAGAPPITYRECLKNHAASIGGHALDGCGEFMPSPAAVPADPTSLKCAACGCHRNFHRREASDDHHRNNAGKPHRHHFLLRHSPPFPPATAPAPPHRNPSPSPSLSPGRSPSPGPTPSPTPSPHSPPPVSHLPPNSFFAAAPPPAQMLLALSADPGRTPTPISAAAPRSSGETSHSRKRFRTKFTQEQKDKMCRFAERLGWKMQRSEEKLVEEFCNEIGVRKGVLKVWMHNNKHTIGKRDRLAGDDVNNAGDHNPTNGVASGGGFGSSTAHNHHHHHDADDDDDEDDDDDDDIGNDNDNDNDKDEDTKSNLNFFANNNGSSSSS